MLEKIYEWLWSRIGGRPWIYIIRHSQEKHPLLWLLLFGALGIVLGHIFW
jgi:hypothetical protein